MKKHAFSLVELSIALTIIGLLVAGISSSRKLIKEAKLKKIHTETAHIEAALETFALSYNGLPGDITNATDYWGTYNASSNVTGTINGNGDGLIDHVGSGTTRESIRAWQQLSKSGIMPDNFSGVEGASGALTIGTQVPESKYSNGTAYEFYGVSSSAMSSSAWHSFGGNFTWHAKKVLWSGYSQDQIYLSAFSSKEAFFFDKKFDDGVMSAGTVRSSGGSNTAGTSWDSCSYSSLNDDIKCLIIKRYGWL